MTDHIIGRGCARRLAGVIAGTMIAGARGSERAVAWMTGNAMFPPLRSFPEAERVWQCGNGANSADEFAGAAIWQELVDELERLLADAGVYMGSPEWDNALYVVDTRRFSFCEDPDGEELEDDWRRAEHDTYAEQTGEDR